MPAFVVEDGTGTLAATSYASIAEADDYLTVNVRAEAWGDVAQAYKEQYLMWATRLLDQRANYVGSRAFEASALRWPRAGVCDRDGIPVANTTVPYAIKAAVIEIAWHLHNTSVDPSANPGSTDPGAIKRIKADVVEIEYQEAQSSIRNTTFPSGLNYILNGYGVIAGIGGSNFVKISRA